MIARDTRRAVVVGAGFAGIAAAAALRHSGAFDDLVVLEARDRVGGRTWSRPFKADGPRVEYGGAWYMPEHDRVRGAMAHHGLSERRHDPVAWRWRTAGVVRSGLPVGRDERSELERVLRRVVADAAADGEGRGSVGRQSCSAYLDALRAPEAVRDFLLGWWSVTGGSSPEVGAVGDALSAVREHGGLLGVPEMLCRSVAEGFGVLAERVLAQADADVRLARPVAAIRARDGAATVFLRDGGAVSAAAVVVAVPLNVLGDIRFDPELPPRIRASLGANRGCAVKMLIRAQGIPDECLVAGRGQGLDLLLFDRRLADGSALLIGFGRAAADFDPTDRDDVDTALRAFHPSATLVDFDSHDWVTDEYARGTWASTPAGDDRGLLDAARFTPHGPIAFASSDFAPTAPGWVEGAMESGAAAAAAAVLISSAV